MTGIILDVERELLRETDRSLQEWGRWSTDDVSPHLGYPSSEPYTRVRGRTVEPLNMHRVMQVEDAYSIWMMCTLAFAQGAKKRENLTLLFILKIHYVEEDLPVADKVYHANRATHRKMSRSTYYAKLDEARKKIAILML